MLLHGLKRAYVHLVQTRINTPSVPQQSSSTKHMSHCMHAGLRPSCAASRPRGCQAEGSVSTCRVGHALLQQHHIDNLIFHRSSMSYATVVHVTQKECLLSLPSCPVLLLSNRSYPEHISCSRPQDEGQEGNVLIIRFPSP